MIFTTTIFPISDLRHKGPGHEWRPGLLCLYFYCSGFGEIVGQEDSGL